MVVFLLTASSACSPPEPVATDDRVAMVRLGTVAPSATSAPAAAGSIADTSNSTTVPVPDTSTTTSGVADASGTEASNPTTTTPPDHGFTVARAVGGWLDTYRSPVDAEVWWSLSNPGPYEGDRVVLVLDSQDDWLLVDLPVRPNGTTAWVHRSDVTLSTHDARIVVDLTAMRLWAWDDGVLVAEGAIALGTDETPTPPGRYFLNEIQAQEDPDTLFGSWILGTSGFSEVLDEVDGGDPAVAIHGTNDPSVLGTRVSLGCIRVHEDVVARLALLPLGTPVEVRA
jgi:lipoprotein-anchoring transpeptidase ErfK/SrfK